eukprot:g4892.t1
MVIRRDLMNDAWPSKEDAHIRYAGINPRKNDVHDFIISALKYLACLRAQSDCTCRRGLAWLIETAMGSPCSPYFESESMLDELDNACCEILEFLASENRGLLKESRYFRHYEDNEILGLLKRTIARKDFNVPNFLMSRLAEDPELFQGPLRKGKLKGFHDVVKEYLFSSITASAFFPLAPDPDSPVLYNRCIIDAEAGGKMVEDFITELKHDDRITSMRKRKTAGYPIGEHARMPSTLIMCDFIVAARREDLATEDDGNLPVIRGGKGVTANHEDAEKFNRSLRGTNGDKELKVGCRIELIFMPVELYERSSLPSLLLRMISTFRMNRSRKIYSIFRGKFAYSTVPQTSLESKPIEEQKRDCLQKFNIYTEPQGSYFGMSLNDLKASEIALLEAIREDRLRIQFDMNSVPSGALAYHAFEVCNSLDGSGDKYVLHEVEELKCSRIEEGIRMDELHPKSQNLSVEEEKWRRWYFDTDPGAHPPCDSLMESKLSRDENADGKNSSNSAKADFIDSIDSKEEEEVEEEALATENEAVGSEEEKIEMHEED